MLVLALGVFTACDDDNSENPTIVAPTTFVLNTPALANEPIDLANSTSLVLTCSQPDYGFPAQTAYTLQMGLKSDLSDAIDVAIQNEAKFTVDAQTLAASLTTLALESGKTEADFPLDIPVYARVKAAMTDKTGEEVANTSITSNTVAYNKVHLAYSLAPVTAPADLYITGSFNGWQWDTAFEMVHVYGTDNVYWRLVWIDGEGIKFNSAKEWDGNEVGIGGITVSGDKAADITGDDNIASKNPGWYLMIVTATVSGREILYDVQFNAPNVWLMGTVTPLGAWGEEEDGCLFTVPTTKDGTFVSPTFANSVSGDGGLRAYVTVPGYDWWKSEFVVLKGVIVYRGTGGDQDRIDGKAGQQYYLNFANGTGEVK